VIASAIAFIEENMINMRQTHGSCMLHASPPPEQKVLRDRKRGKHACTTKGIHKRIQKSTQKNTEKNTEKKKNNKKKP